MEEYGDFFPENPQNLDELLEQMAQRMAAMQAMLNSMTPEQRAQLQQLVRPAARGHGPALADGPARREPPADVPADGLAAELRLRGPGPDGDRPGDADDAGARRPRSAREPAPQRDQSGCARRGRHGPRPRPDGRRRGALARAPRRADQDARGRRPDRAEGGPARADPQGPAQDRLERAARPVRQAGQGQGRPAPDGPHRAGSRAHLRHQAVRVRRSVQPRPPAHDPQRVRGVGRRHAGAPRPRTTSRSSAPSTSPGRRRC